MGYYPKSIGTVVANFAKHLEDDLYFHLKPKTDLVKSQSPVQKPNNSYRDFLDVGIIHELVVS